eukprot:1159696-Pelagomonas_calceolata.AAC.20
MPPRELPVTEVVPGSSPRGGEVVDQNVRTQDDPFPQLTLGVFTACVAFPFPFPFPFPLHLESCV